MAVSSKHASMLGTRILCISAPPRYWQEEFDWRAQEETLNRFAHFRTEIEGFGIHFIHERGHGQNPLPIILTHGFPDSFLRFSKIIPMLTNPAAYGGDPADAFVVVVPSLPGYGFSDKPMKEGMLFRVAALWATLMTQRLDYGRFGAHGGDWGSTVTEHLARSYFPPLERSEQSISGPRPRPAPDRPTGPALKPRQ